MYSTENLNDQMKQFVELQQKSLEPMRIFGGLAVEAFEQMSRKNHAVAGDVVDFSVKQSGLALNGENINETASAQMAESKAFAELMNQRSSEYVDMFNALGGKVRDASSEAAEAFKAA